MKVSGLNGSTSFPKDYNGKCSLVSSTDVTTKNDEEV